MNFCGEKRSNETHMLQTNRWPKKRMSLIVDDVDELLAQLRFGHRLFYSGDPLHPNQLGQEVLAHSLQRAIDLALGSN